MPAPATYSASLPIGMPMPPQPWSPSPRMRSLSVATISRMSWYGEFLSTLWMSSTSSGVIQSPRAVR